MEKTELFASLKSQYPTQIKDIKELDEKKIQIDIVDGLNEREFVKGLRKFILKIQSDAEPVLISVKGNNFKFEFSLYGGIYEFPHNDADYRVEFDLITYVVTINGIAKTFERASFERSEHFRDIAGYIHLIKLHRENFLEYTNRI